MTYTLLYCKMGNKMADKITHNKSDMTKIKYKAYHQYFHSPIIYSNIAIIFT